MSWEQGYNSLIQPTQVLTFLSKHANVKHVVVLLLVVVAYSIMHINMQQVICDHFGCYAYYYTVCIAVLLSSEVLLAAMCGEYHLLNLAFHSFEVLFPHMYIS